MLDSDDKYYLFIEIQNFLESPFSNYYFLSMLFNQRDIYHFIVQKNNKFYNKKISILRYIPWYQTYLFHMNCFSFNF